MKLAASKVVTALLVLLLLGLCAGHGTALVRSDDAWMHLAVGRMIVERGELPERDVFLNSGEPAEWTIHSWLSEVVFYGVMQTGGLPLLMAFRALLIGVTLGILLLLLCRLGAPPWLAALLGCLVLLVPGIRTTLLRPLLFSHLLLVVFLLLLYQVRAGRWSARPLWALPAVMVLWANLHAGHIVGAALALVLPAAMLADRLLKRTPGVLSWRAAGVPAAACVLATLLNPYGPRIWAYALGFTGGGAYQGQVWEWVAASPAREPALFVALGCAWLVLLLRLRRADPLHLLAVLMLTLMPLVATRFLFHGAVGAALALGEGLPSLAAGVKGAPRRWVPRLGNLAAVAVMAWLLWSAVGRASAFAFKVDDSFFPVSAVRFLNANKVSARVLNLREWGGYLMWHRPGQKVFVDGRVAVSAGQVIKDYAAVAEAHRGFGTVLDRQRVDLIVASYPVLRPSPGFDVQPVAHDGNWALVYFDDVALVYARVNAANRDLIQRSGYRWLMPASNSRPFRRGATPAAVEAESRRALSQAPSQRAATYLGLMLMRRGAHAEAEEKLRLAVKLDPRSARAHNNLGVAVMRQGHKDRAKKIFSRVLELDPEHKNARKNLELLNRR